MQQAPQHKNTPGRRRQARNNTPQKTYASENDVSTYKQMHSDSPCTPQKSASGGVAPQQGNSTTHKQRNRNNNNMSSNKNRTKNGGAASPGQYKQNRQSPPLASQEAAAPIFAGSTFHASPAPSAFPIPSFFKANSESPAPRPTPSSAQEPSPPSTDSEDASAPNEHPPVARNDESPLEFFFAADRAEKAKTRRASSANITTYASGPFSPPRDSPQGHRTVPRPAFAHQAPRPNAPSQRNSASGISSNELDGNPHQALGPAFSTPYSERIRAARSNQNSAKATPTASQGNQGRDMDSSEALKRYLFQGKLGPAVQQPSPPQRPSDPQQHNGMPQAHQHQHSPHQHSYQQPTPPQLRGPQQPQLPPGMFTAPVLRGGSSSAREPAPSVVAHGQDQRPDSILTMEDSLRRVLKLGPSN